MLKRTISIMIGKGSVNHNNRKFTAENVDRSRTKHNKTYCNEDIKAVYHEMFDEALERFNSKQTRADRKIPDYYEKVRQSKQEKLFKEIIVQVGNCDDMGVGTPCFTIAKEILDTYYSAFQERNPYLRVFSAHIHMDEATPHLHIDFVPFTTGSKRGLDTRVSLKQALANQGFKGNGRGDTEWNQWILSEKKELAFVMERYGFEWEHKGTHEEHLSVLNYKKRERKKEISALEDKIKEREDEYRSIDMRVDTNKVWKEELDALEKSLDDDPEYQLPDPPMMMSAKNYKTKFVDPLIRKLKDLAKWILSKMYLGWDKYYEAVRQNNRWSNENRQLRADNEKLKSDYNVLYKLVDDFKLITKNFSSGEIMELIREAHERDEKQRSAHYEHLPEKRNKSKSYER